MTVTPLRYLVDLNARVLPESTDAEYTFRYIDISQVASDGTVRIPNEPMRFSEAPSRARRIADPSDTVVSTVRTYLRAIAAVPATEESLVFSTGFAVLHPRRGTDPRFLSYACRSDAFVEEVVARSVGVSYPAIAPSDLLDLTIPHPNLEEQRRIADFLDDRVARIDQIISARDMQLDAMRRARLSSLDDAIRESGPPQRLAWSLALGAVGVVVNPSSYFKDEGVPFVHGYNVRDGHLDLRDLKRMSNEDSIALGRSRLRANDVLVVRAGYPGRAAVVPAELEGGNCASVLLLRPSPALAPEWLAAFLNSPLGRWQVERAQYGAAQGVINLSDVLSFSIPLPQREEQERRLASLRSLERRWQQGTEVILEQVARLREYKQSLITAAVSGELDVSTAGSRIPG